MQAEDVEQRGFPGARRAHDGKEIALANLEVDVTQRVKGSALEGKNAADIAKTDHGRRWRAVRLT